MPKALRFALFGHPVGHSISPDIYRAAFSELKLPHTYEAFDLPSDTDIQRALQALRAGEIAGANITLPHKKKALLLADRCTAEAQNIGAANVLSVHDDQLFAHNTDAPALAEELALLIRQGQHQPRKALVLGAGGAARAVIFVLQSMAIQSIGITTRSWNNDAGMLASEFAKSLQSKGVHTLPYPAHPETKDKFYQFVEQSDLIIQASSAGMTGADPGEEISSLIAWKSLSARTLAYDLVYTPPETPFIAEARKAGLVAGGGLGMLVRQAALSMRAWSLPIPELDVLFSAANQAIIRRRKSRSL